MRNAILQARKHETCETRDDNMNVERIELAEFGVRRQRQPRKDPYRHAPLSFFPWVRFVWGLESFGLFGSIGFGLFGFDLPCRSSATIFHDDPHMIHARSTYDYDHFSSFHHRFVSRFACSAHLSLLSLAAATAAVVVSRRGKTG